MSRSCGSWRSADRSFIALVTGAGMMAEWPTLALFWYAPRATGSVVDPIFGKPLNFFLFTLPAWQLISGWLLTLAVISLRDRRFLPAHHRRSGRARQAVAAISPLPWRGLSITFAFLLLILAMRVYLGRFDLLLDDHTVFSGRHLHRRARHAHRPAPGLRRAGRRRRDRAVNAITVARGRWLLAAVLPAVALFCRRSAWPAGR